MLGNNGASKILRNVALNGLFLLVSNEDEIGRLCGMHGREAYFLEVWWKNLEESTTWRT
jgi:hypothetical protein